MLILADQVTAAAACLDDLASGTLGLEDTLREQAAAREHVALLYRLADALRGQYASMAAEEPTL